VRAGARSARRHPDEGTQHERATGRHGPAESRMADLNVAERPNTFARVQRFTSDVVEEIKKVTWPDWPQLKNATFVIIVFVVIVSALIFLMDWSVRSLLGVIFDLLTR
jgi:preprotein translocase subunit SecE